MIPYDMAQLHLVYKAGAPFFIFLIVLTVFIVDIVALYWFFSWQALKKERQKLGQSDMKNDKKDDSKNDNRNDRDKKSDQKDDHDQDHHQNRKAA